VALEPPPGVEVVVDPTNGQVFQALQSVDELQRPVMSGLAAEERPGSPTTRFVVRRAPLPDSQIRRASAWRASGRKRSPTQNEVSTNLILSR
jgi:hypothetical protein